ncbi:MAG: PEP/pyruvate-binding domain-containing protein [Verrucomicrobiae bacterium]|nr:PEP/pyruvate-binding domain-containing protein [Verrucomicrobiae bacterium]
MENESLSTGIPGLDNVLSGLRPGDNVIWQIDSVREYRPFLAPLVHEAKRRGKPLVYFRFARHAPLLASESGAQIHQLNPQEGFERFLTSILDVIERAGPGAYYVFDCLSDLAADWFSDRMLGNFFMITCPYLYELRTIAYFALQKHVHSFHATDAIFNTAQVIIEVYRKDDRLFIHPVKVWQRSSPTMYMLHSWEGAEFKPVTNSATITDILAGVPKPWLEFTIHRPGIWGQTFIRAQQLANDQRAGLITNFEAEAMFDRLVHMLATRDARMAALVAEYLTLPDLVGIMQRMVGTGMIGGKTLGMLLARAILQRTQPRLSAKLESHDSFYVGSDVFYTYLVQNGCWWLRRKHHDFNVYLERAAQARQKIMQGTFPTYIERQFMEMLEYFGQAPLIVRSSSLLEDSYGNAFSGKYESVFLANQGSPEQRLRAFLDAVRTVYASAMSEESLIYRQQRGLLDSDEQMALLVQRVSGEQLGDLFFPHIAGVGFSFNPFVWHEDIDPRAGVLRLVIGLGTRAVERTGDDYTRLVALNAPFKRHESGSTGHRAYTQRFADVLDLRANALTSRPLEEIQPLLPEKLRALLTDAEPEHGYGQDAALGFDKLFANTDFVPTMRELCRTLHEAYQHPVDIEFTVNFTPDGQYRINLLQCRPFQARISGAGTRISPPTELQPESILLQTRGPIIGQSLAARIDRLIYVVPSAYSKLRMSERGAVARAIGRLTHMEVPGTTRVIMLAGPGRWGTSMPALGVPVTFAEINTVTVLCELALMHEGLVPDVSLGTHFFNDIVEAGILYLAVAPGRPGHMLNETLLRQYPNLLTTLLPSAAGLANTLIVIDPPDLHLHADSMNQFAMCYSAANR